MISGGGPDPTGTVTCSCNHLTNFAVQVVSVCTVMCHSCNTKYNFPIPIQSTEPLVCEQIQDGFVCRCNDSFNLNETTRSTCDGKMKVLVV